MPLGVPLTELRRDLRAETGESLNLAQGVQSQDAYDIILDRQQRELWGAYEWPHLGFAVDVALAAGQSLYSYPVAMLFDQINRIYWSDGQSNWKELTYGIRSWEIPPGATTSGTPRKWANKVSVSPAGVTDPAGQILVYPTPISAGVMRLDGLAPLTPLLSDADRCLIDSTAIVLFSAAEILATGKSEAAGLKLTKAQNYLRRLLQDSGTDKRANYNMGGSHINHLGVRPYSGYRAGIDYIP